jgi:hypothetical protein
MKKIPLDITLLLCITDRCLLACPPKSPPQNPPFYPHGTPFPSKSPSYPTFASRIPLLGSFFRLILNPDYQTDPELGDSRNQVHIFACCGPKDPPDRPIGARIEEIWVYVPGLFIGLGPGSRLMPKPPFFASRNPTSSTSPLFLTFAFQ